MNDVPSTVRQTPSQWLWPHRRWGKDISALPIRYHLLALPVFGTLVAFASCGVATDPPAPPVPMTACLVSSANVIETRTICQRACLFDRAATISDWQTAL